MKRYEPDFYWEQMDEDPAGWWVEYDEVAKLQKQLEEMTKERDHYKRLVELSDALRNAERGNKINPLFNHQGN